VRLTRSQGRHTGGPDDFVAAVATIREAIAAIDLEIVRVRRARVPREEAIARIDAALAVLSGQWDWAANANRFCFPDPPDDPRCLLVPHAHNDITFIIPAFLAAALTPVIRERLVAALPDDPNTISSAERPAKLEALAAERLDLERREERLVLEAEAAGVRLDRRGDLTPSVYLETAL